MSTRREEKLPQRFQLLDRNHIHIVLINGDKILLPYDKTTYLSDIFDEVCRVTKVIEKDLFGLAQEINGFHHYLNLSVKVCKINFKTTRKKMFSSKKQRNSNNFNISGSELSSNSISGPTLFFRVRFYVRPHTLRDRHTKHQYYEQLRLNFLRYPFSITSEQALGLAALILQADHGAYHPARHKGNYFEPNRCLPPGCIARFDVSYLRQHLPALHASHARMATSEAEFRFVRNASAQPTHYNMHLCAALDRSTNSAGEPIWLGISPTGLELYSKRPDGSLSHMSTVIWQQIKKITYKKRLVIVQVGNNARQLRLDTQSSSVAEHVFWLSQQMHLYQITSQMRAPRSVDAVDAQLALRSGYRESYVYSDQNDLRQHGSLSRRSNATPRPTSGLLGHVLASSNGSNSSLHGVDPIPSSNAPSEASSSLRPPPKVEEKRRTSPLPPNPAPLGSGSSALHASTPNLATQSLLETDIDAAAVVEAPSVPGPAGEVWRRAEPVMSGSFRKQRALSCDDGSAFLHPEVRLLQENRALSSSLPLLTQLCRDPGLVQLLEAQDCGADAGGANGGFGHSYGLAPKANGFAGKAQTAPSAGMKSWRSEVLHLDRLQFDDEADPEDSDSVLTRGGGGLDAKFHFRDNDYINLRPLGGQTFGSLQSSLA